MKFLLAVLLLLFTFPALPAMAEIYCSEAPKDADCVMDCPVRWTNDIAFRKNPAHVACRRDEDCTMFDLGGCDSWLPVNKTFEPVVKRATSCIMPDCMPPKHDKVYSASCIKNRCEVVARPIGPEDYRWKSGYVYSPENDYKGAPNTHPGIVIGDEKGKKGVFVPLPMLRGLRTDE